MSLRVVRAKCATKWWLLCNSSAYQSINVITKVLSVFAHVEKCKPFHDIILGPVLDFFLSREASFVKDIILSKMRGQLTLTAGFLTSSYNTIYIKIPRWGFTLGIFGFLVKSPILWRLDRQPQPARAIPGSHKTIALSQEDKLWPCLDIVNQTQRLLPIFQLPRWAPLHPVGKPVKLLSQRWIQNWAPWLNQPLSEYLCKQQKQRSVLPSRLGVTLSPRSPPG